MAMDGKLQEIQRAWTDEVSKLGELEATIRSKTRAIEFYCEIGIMREGDRFEWKPGHWMDARVGALPEMWRRLVLDQRN